MPNRTAAPSRSVAPWNSHESATCADVGGGWQPVPARAQELQDQASRARAMAEADGMVCLAPHEINELDGAPDPRL